MRKVAWKDRPREWKDEMNRRNRERYRTSEVVRERFRRYGRERRATLLGYISNKIWRITLGHSGKYSPIYQPFAEAVTGYSRKEFTDSFGDPSMTIDHIIPISRFDLTNPEHLVRAMHYSNCQSLTMEQNIVKSDTVPEGWNLMDMAWTGREESINLARQFIDIQRSKFDTGGSVSGSKKKNQEYKGLTW